MRFLNIDILYTNSGFDGDILLASCHDGKTNIIALQEIVHVVNRKRSKKTKCAFFVGRLKKFRERIDLFVKFSSGTEFQLTLSSR